MGTLRTIAGKTLGAAIGAAGKAGLKLAPTRDAANHIIGVRALWRGDDADILRGLVIDRDIHGVKARFFVSDESDAIQACHMRGEWYEEPELELIRRYYRGKAFVDVGANVGNHSLFALLALNAPRAIAFEPNPVPYKNCLYTLLLNSLGERVVVHKAGLSNRDEFASAREAQYRNLGATKLERGQGSLVLRIGDEMLAGEEVGFIKIDVEGMEMDVLKGLDGTIRAQRPPILVEVDDANWDAFESLMRSWDYSIAEHIPKIGNSNVVAVAAEQASG